MKKVIYLIAASFAVLTMSISCDDMTDDEKKDAADALTKFALAGEWGCINTIDRQTNEPLFGETSLLDEQGRPLTIWVYNLDGTFYSALNRVWSRHLTEGTWKIDGTKLTMSGDYTDSPEEFELLDYKDDVLTIGSEDYLMLLKRLDAADKCPQLKSVEFTNYTHVDGELYLDPRQSFTNGVYKLTWKYDPEDYEPFYALSFTSSNPSVATVDDNGNLRLVEGVTKGETTVVLTCDDVKAEIVVNLEVIN